MCWHVPTQDKAAIRFFLTTSLKAMSDEQAQTVLTLLKRILSEQREANSMLRDMNKRLRRMEERLDSIDTRLGGKNSSSDDGDTSGLGGVFGTWESLN